MQLAFILGRTPELAKKEIEAAATILPFQWSATIVQPDVLTLKSDSRDLSDVFHENDLLSPQFSQLREKIMNLQKRLGGTIKIVYIIKQVEKDKLSIDLQELIRPYKTYGITVHGDGIDPVRLGLQLKRQSSGSRRFLAPKEGRKMSSAQVIRYRLALFGDRPAGGEVVVICQPAGYLIGVTLTVQDIDAYAKRDFHIPVPDPRSGMLTPKVAQAMLNLAVGNSAPAVYDPFCGSGRVVEEALLMGLPAFGSDIAVGKVEAARKNLNWIAAEYGLSLAAVPERLIWQQDASVLPKTELPRPFVIVTEPYLGSPLRQPLTDPEATAWQAELEKLYFAFFKMWMTVRVDRQPRKWVMVFPAVKCRDGRFQSLYRAMVDRLDEMGYSSLQVSDYGRPSSLVKREIVVLTRRDLQ
ncbi:hypothetical protein KGQ71_03145 [Patescibacteria group bacterium]|nr:hypothetical protein [Patescibacteria group bacterium]